MKKKLKAAIRACNLSLNFFEGKETAIDPPFSLSK